MTALDALRRITDEAADYAASRERFRPQASDLDALRDLHIYREGVRDGRLWAARIAAEVLEQEGLKMFGDAADRCENGSAGTESVGSAPGTLDTRATRRPDAS